MSCPARGELSNFTLFFTLMESKILAPTKENCDTYTIAQVRVHVY